MRFLAYFRTLAARFFHRSRIEDDMEEELRSHIQHRADDLERSGLDRGTLTSITDAIGTVTRATPMGPS